MSALTAWPPGYGAQPLARSPSNASVTGLVGSVWLSAMPDTKLPPLSSSAIRNTSFTVKVPVDPGGALKAIVFAPCTSHCGLISSICCDQLADEGSAKPPCTCRPLIARTACTQEEIPSTE